MNIKETLAEKLKNSSTDVKNNVISSLYADELAARTAACIKVLSKIDEKEKELKKLKTPDNLVFDVDGTVTNSGFTKGRIEEIKKSTKELESLNVALEYALERNEFSKVLELGK